MKTLLFLFLTLTQLLASTSFNTELFEKAKKEHKFIIMDLEAVWCHWCHVMNETTYKDGKVLSLIEKHFILVKVDHDARPDLAQRYREYGWPATIFFDENGTEIVKRSGYISPTYMSNLLQAIIDDPSPEEKEVDKKETFKNASYLDNVTKKELLLRHDKSFDTLRGGLNISQKFLEIDSIEYAMYKASKGDTLQKERAIKTLDAAMNLIDPIWGGAYQYSTHHDWKHPHYEKIMRIQSRYIKSYALAAKMFDDARYLKASKQVASYVFRFLQDKSGAFYVSQDADLIQGEKAHEYFSYDNKKRLSLGIPRVDTHLYSSSQGAMIEALCYLYDASLDKKYLDTAIKTANWTLFNRLLEGGGFSHNGNDDASPYLDDNLKMAKGFLALYQSTEDTRWLKQANFVADFILKNFKAKGAGVLSSKNIANQLPSTRDIDENIQTTRFFNLLSHYSKKERYRKFAQHCMKYLASPEIVFSRITEAGTLLADSELSN